MRMLEHLQPRCSRRQCCGQLADASVDMAATCASSVLSQPQAMQGGCSCAGRCSLLQAETSLTVSRVSTE